MNNAIDCMKIEGLPVHSIIHIGANVGQERYEYLSTGASPVIYVEPINFVYEALVRNITGMPGHVAIKAVCSEAAGEEINFNIASNSGESSSILPLGSHSDLYPHIVYLGTETMITTTVDILLSEMNVKVYPNIMIIDTQGADLKVLRGSVESLKYIDAVFVEVSTDVLYVGGCTEVEITNFMIEHGFERKWIAFNGHGYGDAFYCKAVKCVEPLPSYSGNIALRGSAKQSSLSLWSTPNDAFGAINGWISGGYNFHTEKELEPWWQLDLGDVRSLEEVRVFNRLDAASERSRTLQILVSLDEQDWELVHDQGGYTFGGADGRPLRVILSGKRVRYIKLKINELNYLHLDQVEVY